MPGSASLGAFSPGAELLRGTVEEEGVEGVEELPPEAIFPPVVEVETTSELEAREREDRERKEREARERKAREEREAKERQEREEKGGGGVIPPPEEEHGERPLSDMADEVYAALEPIADADSANGFALRALVRAIASMFMQVEQAVRAKGGNDSWSQTFDPDRTPDFLVPFAGQAVGVLVTEGVGGERQREQVKEERAWKRGRPAQIIGAIEDTLIGEKRVRLIERSSSPWTLTIITRPEETPYPALTEGVARAAVPGGIKVFFNATSLPIIDEATRTINAAEGSIDTATIANIT